MLHHIRLPIVATLLAVSAPIAAEPNAWNDWVRENSPHGFEVTQDGTIWINLYQPGGPDDYAVRAGDLRDAREKGSPFIRFWVRGFHIKNKDVAYRESKTFLQLSCNEQKMRRILRVTFGASGNQLSKEEMEASDSIVVPGTYAAEMHRLFCQTPR